MSFKCYIEFMSFFCKIIQDNISSSIRIIISKDSLKLLYMPEKRLNYYALAPQQVPFYDVT